MKYICLCYDEEAKLKALPTSEMDAIMREVYAYAAGPTPDLRSRPPVGGFERSC